MAKIKDPGIWQDILDGDPTAYVVYGDYLEDRGDPVLGYAYRWCGFNGHRPGKRQSNNLKEQLLGAARDLGGVMAALSGVVESSMMTPTTLIKPWVWFCAGDHSRMYLKELDEQKAWDDWPQARLPKQVFYGLFSGAYRVPRLLYRKLEDAMRALAESLQNMKQVMALKIPGAM